MSSCARSTRSRSASSRAPAGRIPLAMSASISRRWPRKTARFASRALGPAAMPGRSSGTSTNASARRVISAARIQKFAMKRFKGTRELYRSPEAIPSRERRIRGQDGPAAREFPGAKDVEDAMRILGPQATKVIEHPGRFALQTLKAFKANQGLLLAGAVAYYALLSIFPLP